MSVMLSHQGRPCPCPVFGPAWFYRAARDVSLFGRASGVSTYQVPRETCPMCPIHPKPLRVKEEDSVPMKMEIKISHISRLLSGL